MKHGAPPFHSLDLPMSPLTVPDWPQYPPGLLSVSNQCWLWLILVKYLLKCIWWFTEHLRVLEKWMRSDAGRNDTPAHLVLQNWDLWDGRGSWAHPPQLAAHTASSLMGGAAEPLHLLLLLHKGFFKVSVPALEWVCLSAELVFSVFVLGGRLCFIRWKSAQT